MKRFSWVLGLLAGVSLSVGTMARAELITLQHLPFDAHGTGGLSPAHQVVSFDWDKANMLAQGANQAIANYLSDPASEDVEFETYMHTRLSGLKVLGPNGSESVNLPGLNEDFEVTFVTRFRERVAHAGAVGSGDGGFAIFDIVGSADSFFEVYYDDFSSGSQASDLEGTGFNDGQLILSGSVTDLAQGAFLNNLGSVGQFDQVGEDQYGGLESIIANGSANFTVAVDYFDPAFFLLDPDLVTSFELNFAGVGISAPFTEVDPSRRFTTEAGGATPVFAGAGTVILSDGTIIDTGTMGLVQGQNLLLHNSMGGADIQFQTDASNSVNVELVPEPATATLGLMGLGALAAGLRRRRAAA